MPLIHHPPPLSKYQARLPSEHPTLKTNLPPKECGSCSFLYTEPIGSAFSSGSPVLEIKEAYDPYNLFTTCEGLKLPVEICLEIVEDVINIDPKHARVLMCLSKVFLSLLKSYEYSIIKRLITDQNFYNPVCLSLAPPESVNIRPFSYPWLLEVRSRVAVGDLLVQHDVSDLSRLGIREAVGSQSHILPSKPQLRMARIKKDVLLLMYQMVDSTAGLKKKHSIRTRQIEFLEMLTPLELAKLGCFVKALGLGYSKHMELQPDPIKDRFTRERICVFEDKVLRYGPFFAWATIAGTERACRWGRIIMLDGLNDLHDFERGQSMAYASLQSVVWNLFCKRAECNLADSWAIMKEMIDGQMDFDDA